MMKYICKILLIVFLIFNYSTVISYAQNNLVPNPSFENPTPCPDDDGQIYRAIPWFQTFSFSGSLILGSSSDLFNTCSIYNPPNGDVRVPNNGVGSQYPRTGNGYAGIEFWGANDDREYIEVRLTEYLQKNKNYCVEFYVSLGEISDAGGTDCLQVVFTNDSLLNPNASTCAPFCTILINMQPSVANYRGNIIDDSTNWVKISGTYKALGGERFITIGNFYQNSSCIVQDSVNTRVSYYFIDDVSVTLCNEPEIIIPNVFSPNTDGINDLWEVGNLPKDTYVQIYNRWGIMIAGVESPYSIEGNYKWDGKTKTGIACSSGTYYYIITTKEKTYKGFIQLIK